MRLATFNVLHGRSLVDGRVDADRLGRAVAGLDADVIGLQEVDRDQPRSGGLDLTATVAAALGAADWRFVPALIGTPGGSWHAAGDDVPPGSPAYGVGLVSRLPVRSWHVVRLPAAPVRSPILLPGTKQVFLLTDEPRVALAAVVDSPLGVLTVATAHLSFVPGWNAWQLWRVGRALAGLPYPQLLLADLNLPGPVPGALTRWRSLGRLQTYPSPAPRVQLDHVLGRGALPPVTGVAAPALDVSDHRPLVVDL